MKNFLILFSILLIAIIVRFYNYEDRIIFWNEQARSLITSLEYLDKPTLLGQEYYRMDSNSHVIYSGAVFNYLLLPIILISNYSPIKITIFFTILNILTGVLVFLVAKKFFSHRAAIYSAILFLFGSLMVYHSLFIWNYNLLPLVGLIIFYLTLLNIKNFSFNNMFWLGLVSGFGISLQIVFVIYGFVILIANTIKASQRIIAISLFLIGMVIGNLPMVLFDIRHDFYHAKTIFQYLIDTFKSNSDAGFAYYYLLPLIPIIAIVAGIVLSKLNQRLSIVLIAVYLMLNINFSSLVNPKNPLTVGELDKAARTISENSREDINVASMLDFDKRVYALRYYLKYVYQVKVMSVESYASSKSLYVLAPNDFNFATTDTWEIKSGWPYNVSKLSDINEMIALYKLSK